MLPNIDFAKVQSIIVKATNEGAHILINYKSGQSRGYDSPNADIFERVRFMTKAQEAGVHIEGYSYQTMPFVKEQPVPPAGAQPESQPAADPAAVLANLLGLTEDQAKLLPGATRLNFWRNGCLNIQIQHGSRSIKFPCPKAPSDSDLVTLLFDDWKWSRLEKNRLYFRPSKEARVIL